MERLIDSANVLSVPREARDYISEQGECRSFNLDSFGVDKGPEPHRVSIRLGIAQKGAEQLIPLTVRLELAEPAGRQLNEALVAALNR